MPGPLVKTITLVIGTCLTLGSCGSNSDADTSESGAVSVADGNAKTVPTGTDDQPETTAPAAIEPAASAPSSTESLTSEPFEGHTPSADEQDAPRELVLPSLDGEGWGILFDVLFACPGDRYRRFFASGTTILTTSDEEPEEFSGNFVGPPYASVPPWAVGSFRQGGGNMIGEYQWPEADDPIAFIGEIETEGLAITITEDTGLTERCEAIERYP